MTDTLAWETLASRTSYSCEGFDVVTDEVLLPDGTETEFDYLSEGESVVILPFTTDGEVVVIEEWRQAVDRVSRGLPAGGMEDEEDAEAAAHRELAEETGFAASAMEPLVTVEPTNGSTDVVHHFFVGRECTPIAERDLDYNESIAVETTAFEELLATARRGSLRDGRAMLGVCYYALFESVGDDGTERE